ncbi:Glycosyltransferase involved in cell wall bisynthesis [Maribacter dokdonensis]|uniref:glycosyltransferase family 4 protein n=1 Tax=Maribacter dokdonensis TaxID=320912 RepID=UPI001B15600E|nr:glycosyltransferase family 1 protein [Maribacter dokdonensis]CAG2532202.1 Glycosyltransferase involved in cell wall bisynthesis [Maribacter dokdonensis]
MKIAYDAKRIFHNNTGLGNYGRDIVRILRNQGLIDHFYLFNTKKSEFESCMTFNNTTIVYPKGWLWSSIPSLWRFIGQWKQVQHLNVSFYHGLSGEIPIQLKRNNIPKIVTIHDLIFLTHPDYYNFFDRIIYKIKFKYAVTTANHIIAISEQTKADTIKYLNADEKKISVIYQGCNAAFKKQYTESEKLKCRQKFKLPQQYVLNVGTLQERKNALALIKAINGTKHHLVLVGHEKGYAKKLHKYIAANNLEKQVSFIKNITTQDLALIYQNATIFCYPSFCEGFGIPIIEALFSGLPVITTKFGCFPEAAGPNSLYVNPSDENEIRDKINLLFEHPELRVKLKEAGLQFVQKFSDENVAKNLINLYKKVL